MGLQNGSLGDLADGGSGHGYDHGVLQITSDSGFAPQSSAHRLLGLEDVISDFHNCFSYVLRDRSSPSCIIKLHKETDHTDTALRGQMTNSDKGKNQGQSTGPQIYQWERCIFVFGEELRRLLRNNGCLKIILTSIWCQVRVY